MEKALEKRDKKRENDPSETGQQPRSKRRKIIMRKPERIIITKRPSQETAKSRYN